jgi:ring-1,2-phenylacetyl-CoA epoxidase subunit PaaD
MSMHDPLGATDMTIGMTMADEALAVVRLVPDPEIPALTIEDLGILRGVVVAPRGGLLVRLTPTYVGCPATLAIEQAVAAALQAAGIRADVETVLDPPWTTADITEQGRARLLAYGIAPPNRPGNGNRKARALAQSLFEDDTVACPRCGSLTTSKISQFGSTACKALWRCDSCREPFDYFKCL